MGLPKGLLSLRGKPLLRYHVDRLRTCTRVIVVALGREAEAHRAILGDGIRTVLNPDWATTEMADSLRLALIEADVRGPCFVMPVDVPPPRSDTLRALLEAGAPAVPVDAAGRTGHPVLLDAGRVAAIRARAPAGGVRELLDGVRRVPVADPDVALDFDDPESWRAFEQRWDGG